MSDEKLIRDAGASTDQHVTGVGETGEFTTDKAPTGDTPPSGSNAGVNAVHANRTDSDPEADADVTG
jgi:hypothetical protein